MPLCTRTSIGGLFHQSSNRFSSPTQWLGNGLNSKCQKPNLEVCETLSLHWVDLIWSSSSSTFCLTTCACSPGHVWYSHCIRICSNFTGAWASIPVHSYIQSSPHWPGWPAPVSSSSVPGCTWCVAEVSGQCLSKLTVVEWSHAVVFYFKEPSKNSSLENGSLALVAVLKAFWNPSLDPWSPAVGHWPQPLCLFLHWDIFSKCRPLRWTLGLAGTDTWISDGDKGKDNRWSLTKRVLLEHLPFQSVLSVSTSAGGNQRRRKK